MTKAHEHYQEAIRLRDRAIAGQTNQTPIQAWASVCRECAIADWKRRAELKADHNNSDNRFFRNLQQVWWFAKAQVETMQKQAAQHA